MNIIRLATSGLEIKYEPTEDGVYRIRGKHTSLEESTGMGGFWSQPAETGRRSVHRLTSGEDRGTSIKL